MAQETFRNMNQSVNGEHIYFSDFPFTSRTQPEPCSEAGATLAPSEEEAGGLSSESTAEQQRSRLFFTTHSAQDFNEYDDSYDSMDEVGLTLDVSVRADIAPFLPPLPLVERDFIQKESELEEEDRLVADVEKCLRHDGNRWTVSSAQTSAVETLGIQSITLPTSVHIEEVTEDSDEEQAAEEAIDTLATSNPLSCESSEAKKDQVKISTTKKVAVPLQVQQLMTPKVELVLDNEASRKRKRAPDSLEAKGPEPSSQRAKLVGAALAGMVVGSVGTIFALASM